MNLVQDAITYMRRILKTPSNQSITDDLLIDYLNRFYIMDVDARIQLFDLKTTYAFQTQPGVDRYNMPLYNIQNQTPTGQTITSYPVYQGFMGPATVNGYQMNYTTLKSEFDLQWPPWVQQNVVVGQGNGADGPYTLTIPIAPFNTIPLNPPIQALLRGHVDMQGIIATGNNIDPPVGTSMPIASGQMKIPFTSISSAIYFVSSNSAGENVIVQDSGVFLPSNVNYGLLIAPGNAPFGYSELANGGSLPFTYQTNQNTINYLTGVATNVYFPDSIPVGVNISAQCFFYEAGLPRTLFYYNNVITLRSPPDKQYLINLDAYLSPCAFFSTENAVPYAYMTEYLARGAARKILADTGDVDQFQFYEPLFREQEILVWKRSQRQFTSTRTPTIYSQGMNQGSYGYNNQGGNII